MEFAMRNFKDESFILQFLSPRLIRELKLIGVEDDANRDYLEVTSIHDEPGYEALREALAATFDLGEREPDIQVHNVNVRSDRSLTLRHEMYNGRVLQKADAEEVVRHLHTLWGFDVILESAEDGKVRQSIRHSELEAR
jgi:spore cortex formation protein SpoVR/YcgB (stage V sporulation)